MRYSLRRTMDAAGTGAGVVGADPQPDSRGVVAAARAASRSVARRPVMARV